MTVVCPKCRKDDMIQKVSSIYSSGIASGTTYGISQTALSRQLAPPDKPSVPGSTSAILASIALVWVALSCGGCALLGAVEGGGLTGDAPGFLLIALLAGGVGVAMLTSTNSNTRRNTAKVAAEMPRWEKAMHRWNDLYYCARDDGVFNSTENEFVSIQYLREYLYR